MFWVERISGSEIYAVGYWILWILNITINRLKEEMTIFHVIGSRFFSSFSLPVRKNKSYEMNWIVNQMKNMKIKIKHQVDEMNKEE